MKNIEVAAALIEKDHKILITRRKKETHLGNYWEFPGGKKEKGEDLKSCLIREIREELGIEIDVKNEVFTTSYDYPDRRALLHFFSCDWKSGDPKAVGCREFRWIEITSVGNYEFPPANRELIQQLKNDGLVKSRYSCENGNPENG